MNKNTWPAQNTNLGLYFASCLIRDRLLCFERGWEKKIYCKIKLFAGTPLPGLKNGKWTSLLINNSF